MMKTTNLRGFFLLSIFLSIFLLYGCDKTVKYSVNVTMKNNSSEETHLWTFKESMDPANKLAPGASRSDKITIEINEDFDNEDVSENVTVYAGRNGATLTSKTFIVMLHGTSALNVVYSGGALTLAK